MIWLDDNGKVVIKTDIQAKDIYEVVEMKKSVLSLLSSQDKEMIDGEENYWAIQLIKLLDPEPEQICLKKEQKQEA
jgi:hypothetical protein